MARKVGRPFKFTPEEFELAWQQYFQWCDDNPWIRYDVVKGGENAGMQLTIPIQRPYTEMGFCVFHDLGEDYLRQLYNQIKDRDDEVSKQFSGVLLRARAKCYSQKFEGATVGIFNANIIGRELGLMEKIDHSSSDGSMSPKSDLTKLSLEEKKALRELIAKTNE